MRKDMKNVITDDRKKRSGKSVRRKKDKTPLDEAPKFRATSQIKSQENLHNYSSPRRFSPLVGFLRKFIGKPWNDAYSEICEANKSKNGKVNLKEEIERLVNFTGQLFRHEYHQFFVDEKGLLRQKEEKRKRRYKDKYPKAIRSEISNLVQYQFVDGVWYETFIEYKNGNDPYEDIFKGRPKQSVSLENKFGLKPVIIHKRQLSSKEIKKLDLKKHEENLQDFRKPEEIDTALPPEQGVRI